MTKPIDLAIRSAALSILAACSPPASSPDDVTRDDRRGPDSLVVDDGEVLQHEEVRVEAPDPRDPTATCVEYRESVSGTSADPRGLPAKPRQRRMGPPSQEVWGGRVGGGIQCTLTWDVTEADVEVTVTPTCCPMPG
ncbi:MAG: hypothetical protein KC731_13415, partial [Myxococcales bacterium]|nr:hypothetical protein [Myxococcales bacterium]